MLGGSSWEISRAACIVGICLRYVELFVGFQTCLQGYERQELWGADAFRHLRASGHSMPATWSLLAAQPASGAEDGQQREDKEGQQQQLWVHVPEGSYRWEDVAHCPVYVRYAACAVLCCAVLCCMLLRMRPACSDPGLKPACPLLRVCLFPSLPPCPLPHCLQPGGG